MRYIVLSLLLSVLACTEDPELVRLPAEPPRRLIVQGVALLDVVGGQILEGRDVLVEDGQVAQIAPGGSLRSREGDTVVDGAGQTLLPGLIDSHSHLHADRTPVWQVERGDAQRNMRQYLYSGVTTVLEGAGPVDSFELRDRVEQGELLGTRIFTAGPMLTAPNGHPTGLIRTLVFWPLDEWVISSIAREVKDTSDIDTYVAELANIRADFIKVAVDRLPSDAPRLSSQSLKHIVAAARTRGLRTIAHIGTVQDAMDAGDAGVSIWMHGVYRERIPEDRISKLASFGIPMVPTTTVFEAYRTTRNTRVATTLEKEVIPGEILSAYNDKPEEVETGGMDDVLEDIQTLRRAWLENIKRLHDAGVPMFAGSDCQPGVFAGPGVHNELDLLHEAGLTPIDVIRGATLLPARFLEQKEVPTFGHISAGAHADLVLVEGNPLEDWEAIHRIRAVIRSGMLLDRLPLLGP